MTTVVLIEGTWTGAWAREGSPFRAHLARQGFQLPPDGPFEWSGNVAGLPRAISWWRNDKFSDWRAGGAALRWYLRALPYADRNVIAHSHGGQLALFAASQYDTWIRRLITVATPCRGDLAGVTRAALPNIAHWTHVSSREGDLIARLGQLFDGRLRRGRTQVFADVNATHPGIGHSKVLTDPAYFPVADALLDIIRAPDATVGGRAPPSLKAEG